ncbi:mycofactocin oligosaccharide methyltransferase MftM [Gordonia crocea]|uniref:SAM-dependent methyltransferase n=1 Tax=Gordonia crocea TaxID=589162 RepID=A0A7I9UX01_9ACTN|nr:mycofactocin oligosaccharide methyltransferase MftM [Gordonia crocea]GED97463.1 SAM-dependent methyltransferase [Gordonia crocea]
MQAIVTDFPDLAAVPRHTVSRHTASSTAVSSAGPLVVAHRVRAAAAGGGRWRCDRRPDGSVVVSHPLDLATVSDDQVVGALSRFAQDGLLIGQDEFEQAAIAVITSLSPDHRACWRAFYANSVAQLRDGRAAFSPVHRRARSLLRGQSVLEVGCCFGLFALQCAQDGYDVTACDICPGALDLLGGAAADFGLPVTARIGNALSLPFAPGSFDTVTLIHLLEHLDGPAVGAAIGEALRVASRRVVIAVPFEEHPNAHFGHRQRLTEGDLREWARDWPAYPSQTIVDHGGWLVLDHRVR